MPIRDEEIKRLIKYAQGLNTQVSIIKGKPHRTEEAEWAIDGSQIIVYTDSSTSKINIILSLIHEIGHHLAHIYKNDRKVDEKLEQALDDEDESKRTRRKIYNWELEGTKWWETIYKDTDCKFNINKLYISREFDLWQYEVYLETGRFPSMGQKYDKRKQLKNKFDK